jgi:hypothetical protein
MMDSRDGGEPIMKRAPGDTAARAASADEFVRTTAVPAVAKGDVRVTSGNVLWTLTNRNSTAQARRWITPAGFEFEMHIWTGARVEGQEDLCWTQLFTTEAALADAALAKKRQLEAAGWLETIDTSAR